jgi:hypothetical protein
MAVTINASTTTGLVQSADTSGSLNIQSNGTTVLGVTSTGTSVTGTQSVSGNLSFNSGYGSSAVAYGCRAWVNFNGTGTPAIRASGNVTSITDNGAGDYTVNFTNAMPDANYCFNLSANDDGTGTGGPAQSNGFTYGSWKRGPNSCVYNTSSVRFQIGYPANTDLYDQTHINVAIFR